MTSIFSKVNQETKHKPSMLYIRDYFDSRPHMNVKALSVAYDLLLINREVKDSFITQVFVELAYAVTNPKDNFDRAIGRKIAIENLEDAGQTKSNYANFYLGNAFDILNAEFLEQLGVEFKLPIHSVPLRLLSDGTPWLHQKDGNLTGAVQEAALIHLSTNPLYN